MGSKENSSLVSEVVTLFSSMQQFRRELASIRHPEQSEDRFDTVSEQLDAIVAATEDATNKILGAIEEIGELVDTRREDLEAAGGGVARLVENWRTGVNSGL